MSRGLPDDEIRRRNNAAQVAQGYRTAHEVISAAISLGLLVWGGFWLDQKFGLKPWLTIVGAALGFVVAGVSLRQILRRLDQESARKKKKKSADKETLSE